MINQAKMAEAFKNANAKVASVRVKSSGERDGNGMRSLVKSLKRELQEAGVTEEGAHTHACKWFHSNRMGK